VIIDNFDVVRLAVDFIPVEDQPPLVIDADGPLSVTSAFEFLQPIFGWRLEISNRRRGIEDRELSFSRCLERAESPMTLRALEQVLYSVSR
jgi:hypothetical protein